MQIIFINSLHEKMILVNIMKYTETLKQLREDNNLTQNDLANILNISRGLYSQYEIADKIIPINHLEKLSTYFKISIDYLLGFTKNKPKKKERELNKAVFSLRLKEFRKENNLTQEKLAQILNTSHSVISSYEKEKTLIITSFLYTICKKYNISADYLLGKTDYPKYLK